MEDVLDPVNDDGAFFIGHVQHAFDAQQAVAVGRPEVAEPAVKGEPVERLLRDKRKGADAVSVTVAVKGADVEPSSGVALLMQPGTKQPGRVDLAALALDEKPPQRILEGAAHGAADAPARQHDGLAGDWLDQEMVERDLAELVDDHRAVSHLRPPQ